MDKNTYIKKFIEAFLYRGKGENIAVNCLTRYQNYDKEMINNNLDAIYEFAADNFNIISSTVDPLDIMNDKDDQWLYLKTLEELDLLEDLIGLLIVSGVLVDSIEYRENFARNIEEDIVYLDKTKFDLKNRIFRLKYLVEFKNYILPYFLFNVSTRFLDYQNNLGNLLQFSESEIKDLLCFWWEQESGGYSTDAENKIFFNLVENDPESILDLVTYYRLEKNVHHNSISFLQYMRSNKIKIYCETVNKVIDSFNEKAESRFTLGKTLLLSDLNRNKMIYEMYYKEEKVKSKQ